MSTYFLRNYFYKSNSFYFADNLGEISNALSMQLTCLIWGKSAEKAKHRIIETNGNHAADASARSKLFQSLKKK